MGDVQLVTHSEPATHGYCFEFGVGGGIRTPDPKLGKVAHRPMVSMGCEGIGAALCQVLAKPRFICQSSPAPRATTLPGTFGRSCW